MIAGRRRARSQSTRGLLVSASDVGSCRETIFGCEATVCLGIIKGYLGRRRVYLYPFWHAPYDSLLVWDVHCYPFAVSIVSGVGINADRFPKRWFGPYCKNPWNIPSFYQWASNCRHQEIACKMTILES